MFLVCNIDQITCWRKLGTRRKPPIVVSHWQTVSHIIITLILYLVINFRTSSFVILVLTANLAILLKNETSNLKKKNFHYYYFFVVVVIFHFYIQHRHYNSFTQQDISLAFPTWIYIYIYT